jgi:hypothetical protein
MMNMLLDLFDLIDQLFKLFVFFAKDHPGEAFPDLRAGLLSILIEVHE